MANQFLALLDNESTEKFFLARLEPARDITADLTLESGTTYTATMEQFSEPIGQRSENFAMDVSSLASDGSPFTLTTSSTPPTSHYSYNPATRLLRVNLGAALVAQTVVVKHYLYFASERARQTFLDPLDDVTGVRRWVPRIQGELSVKYNQSDIVNGFFSYTDSTLQISNQDGYFEQFLNDNDSFANKEATFWVFLDAVENGSIAQRGIIKSISVGDVVVFKILDELSKLESTLFSNGSLASSIYSKAQFPDVDPERENDPIPVVYHPTSTYKIVSDPTSPPSYRIDENKLLDAVCIDYNKDKGTALNREWGTVIDSGGDHGEITQTTISVDQTSGTHTIIEHDGTEVWYRGDTFDVQPGNEWSIVIDVPSSTTIKIVKNTFIIAGKTMTRPGISSIVIEQGGSFFYPIFKRDYTVSYTGNPNGIAKIVFLTNFEANLSMPESVHASDTAIRFRSISDTASTYNHSDVLKTVIEAAGLTVNAASFATAKTGLTDQTNFQVPLFRASDFPTVAQLAQGIMAGAFGYLTVNNDLEIEYRLFDAPSSSVETNQRHILNSTLVTDLEYEDLADAVTGQNDHEIIEADFSPVFEENTNALYLHEVSRTQPVDHLLDEFTRASDILDVLSNRQAYYRFKTKTHNLDNIIGDDILLNPKNLIGSGTSRSVKILSTTKTPSEVTITATDLLGL